MRQSGFQGADAGRPREVPVADERRVADHRVEGRGRVVFEKVAHGDGGVETRLAKPGFGGPGGRCENLHPVEALPPAGRTRSDALQPVRRREKDARLAARRFENRVVGGANRPRRERVRDFRRGKEGAPRLADRPRLHLAPPLPGSSKRFRLPRRRPRAKRDFPIRSPIARGRARADNRGMRRATAPAPLATTVFAAASAAAVALSVADAPAQEPTERLPDRAAEREAVTRAAARVGCEARTLTRLSTPHDGVWQVRCRDSLILWLHRVDGAWTVKPIG